MKQCVIWSLMESVRLEAALVNANKEGLNWGRGGVKLANRLFSENLLSTFQSSD